MTEKILEDIMDVLKSKDLCEHLIKDSVDNYEINEIRGAIGFLLNERKITCMRQRMCRYKSFAHATYGATKIGLESARNNIKEVKSFMYKCDGCGKEYKKKGKPYEDHIKVCKSGQINRPNESVKPAKEVAKKTPVLDNQPAASAPRKSITASDESCKGCGKEPQNLLLPNKPSDYCMCVGCNIVYRKRIVLEELK